MAKEKIDLAEFKANCLVALEVLKEVIHQSETAQDIVDKFFDQVENYIVKSKTKIDDTIGLPACALVRGLIGVPDND